MAKRKKNERPVILTEEKTEVIAGSDGAKIEGSQTGDPVDSEFRGSPQNDEPAEETKDPVAASEEILANLETYKEALAEDMPEMEPRKRGRKKKEESSVVIPPELFVFICDNATSQGFAMIDRLIVKKGKPAVKADQLSLRPEQAEKLYPVAEKAIEAMKLSDDPIRAFFGSLLAIQFTNYVLIKSQL